MRRTALVLTSLIVLLAIVVPGSATAFDRDGAAVVEAGGHLVLMNFTVEDAPSSGDMSEAGSVRYLVYLDDGSEQTSYDVLLMNVTEYLKYLAGGNFTYLVGPSSLSAGETPAFGYQVFTEEGSYVLLVDNSDKGGVPNASAELRVNFSLLADNADVQRTTQWLPFILLMVFVALVGVLFLVALNIVLNARLKRKMEEVTPRCPNCNGVLPDYGKYCPHCGKEL